MTEIKLKNNNYNFIDTLNLFLIGLYPVAIISGNFFINLFTQKDLVQALEEAERRIKREKKQKEKQNQSI